MSEISKLLSESQSSSTSYGRNPWFGIKMGKNWTS